MDPYDHLFRESAEDDDNAGEILSEDDVSGNEEAPGESGNGDDAGSPKPVKVEPKKKTVRNPRNTLNADKLCGPRGIIALKDHFESFKFRGKGHEADDLNRMMRHYEHWAHRMFPKYHFDDCVAKIEQLGQKKWVQMYMNKYRSGLLLEELAEAAANRSAGNEDDSEPIDDAHQMDQPLDPLDSMLDEQIALSRGRSSLVNTSGIGNLSMDTTFDAVRREQSDPKHNEQTVEPPSLNEDIRAKIESNRQKALELRKARQQAMSQSENLSENVEL